LHHRTQTPDYPGGKRNKVWEAKSDTWQAEGTRNMLRRIEVLFYGRGDPSILGRYRLGTARSVAEWGDAIGLDLSD